MHHLNSLDFVKAIFYKNAPMHTTEGHLLLDSLAQSHFLGSVVLLRVLNTLGIWTLPQYIPSSLYSGRQFVLTSLKTRVKTLFTSSKQ